jgi:hypothetical protein
MPKAVVQVCNWCSAVTLWPVAPHPGPACDVLQVRQRLLQPLMNHDHTEAVQVVLGALQQLRGLVPQRGLVHVAGGAAQLAWRKQRMRKLRVPEIGGGAAGTLAECLHYCWM